MNPFIQSQYIAAQNAAALGFAGVNQPDFVQAPMLGQMPQPFPMFPQQIMYNPFQQPV
jgi:hypothetical protein